MAARGAQNPELSPPPDADPDVEPLPRGAFRCRLCHVIAANRSPRPDPPRLPRLASLFRPASACNA